MASHIVVVGGSRGIGRTFVKRMMERHVVSVISRRKPNATLAFPNAVYWSLDITDRNGLDEGLRRVVEANGRLRNLVFFQRHRSDADDWDGELETSLTATRNVIDSLAETFQPSGDRSIVIVSSVNARWINPEVSLSYHVAKAGVEQIVRYYAVVLGRAGIRVNSVSPSTVTKKGAPLADAERQELYESYRKAIPLGRLGTAQEVANVVAFLCGSESSFINGQNIVVDGGASLLWQESLAHEATRAGKGKAGRDATGQ